MDLSAQLLSMKEHGEIVYRRNMRALETISFMEEYHDNRTLQTSLESGLKTSYEVIARRLNVSLEETGTETFMDRVGAVVDNIIKYLVDLWERFLKYVKSWFSKTKETEEKIEKVQEEVKEMPGNALKPEHKSGKLDNADLLKKIAPGFNVNADLVIQMLDQIDHYAKSFPKFVSSVRTIAESLDRFPARISNGNLENLLNNVRPLKLQVTSGLRDFLAYMVPENSKLKLGELSGDTVQYQEEITYPERIPFIAGKAFHFEFNFQLGVAGVKDSAEIKFEMVNMKEHDDGGSLEIPTKAELESMLVKLKGFNNSTSIFQEQTQEMDKLMKLFVGTLQKVKKARPGPGSDQADNRKLIRLQLDYVNMIVNMIASKYTIFVGLLMHIQAATSQNILEYGKACYQAYEQPTPKPPEE